MQLDTIYIGLGSNLDEPVVQIKEAVEAIADIPATNVVAVSSLYGSQPMGPQDQPDYINAVLALTTELSPIELLDQLQRIENESGRIRKERWGARTLDLDILLFGEQLINEPRLVVPHYGMKEREFVLIPLAEIAPDLTLPCGESVTQLSEQIARNGLHLHCQI